MGLPERAASAPRENDSQSRRVHWSVADLLRGDYKQSEYGKVILPLTVIRRLDCVLEPTKEAVLAQAQAVGGQDRELEPAPGRRGRPALLHTSPLTSRKLLE